MPTAYRTLTTGVATAALLVAAVGPAAATTTTIEEARGTSVLRAVPLHVEALSTPVDVGTATMMATTDTDTLDKAPFASLGLTLLDVAGARFGELTVASDGDTSNDGMTVDESTPVGAISATAGNLLAIADESAESATAAITTLTTDASVLEGLGIEATLTDAVTSVDDNAAAGTLGLAVAGIDLELAHVLGTILDELPLSDLLALADELGVAVPVNLDPVDDVVTATEDLVAAVTAAVASADAVEAAAQALLTADGGTLAALEGLVTDVSNVNLLSLSLVDDLQAILDDADFPAGCDVDLLSVTIDQGLLDSITACLQAEITSHLASLADSLTALETAVSDYVAAVQAAVAAAAAGDTAAGSLSITDILDDIAALVEGLLDVDLAGIGPIQITQQVRAVGDDLAGSSASHTCSLTTISGSGVTPLDVDGCQTGDELDLVLETITGTLRTVLDVVGGVDAGEGVSLQLFGVTEDTVSEGEDGFVRATSVLEVLRLTVPDITISACEVADGLVCGLGIDIDGTLADVLATLSGALTTAQTTAEGAVNSVTDLLTALGATDLITDVTGVDATAAQTAVDDAVTLLTTALDSLVDALGDLGTVEGVTIPGVELVVDPTLESEHQVTTATVESPAPADPAPADPEDDPTLPNTGGGAALLAVLAMGAGAWLWRRREAA